MTIRELVDAITARNETPYPVPAEDYAKLEAEAKELHGNMFMPHEAGFIVGVPFVRVPIVTEPEGKK